MKRLLSLLAGVVLCTSAFSQVPAPVQMIPADGKDFRQAATIPNEIQEPSQSYVLFGTPVTGSARYVRFVAHPTRGFQFLDEIVVN